MKARILLMAGAIMTVTGVAALAHGGATGVVKERMEAMGAMKDAVKSLTEIMRGDVPYKADQVKRHAATIKSHAGDAMIRLFPKGSNKKPSEARSKIWTDWDAFEDQAKRLETLAKGLEQAAASGLGGDDGPSDDSMGVSDMMGLGGQDATSGETMMGGNGMMGSPAAIPDQEMLASMPADGVFEMLTDACTSCHTQYRLEKKS